MVDRRLLRRISSGVYASLLALTSIVLAAPVTSPVRAAANTYYFHGVPADQANKGTTPGAGSAYFNTTAPSGVVPITQTSSPQANRDLAGNPLAAYWNGPFSGTLSGDI